MFEKLEEVEKKYNDLNERLASGNLSPNELRSVGKEQSTLRETVETFQQYKLTKQELEDNQELLKAEDDDEMRTLAKEEIVQLEKTLIEIEEQLKILLLPTDPNDEKNTILEIRAGTGGEEAALFAADLFRMYSRYADLIGWKVEILSSSDTGKGGFKEIIAMISGNRVFSKLKYESGVHRVQRVPDTESSGRIHTSAVSVAVLPEAGDIELEIPANELRVDVMRSGGAGGQSVNTTDSAVRITHEPSGIVVVCQDERSQHKNKAKGMKILRSRLLDKLQREQFEKEAAERKAMVGSGDRSEKIRTYNFPQSRITDHRINLTIHQLEEILDGSMDQLVEPIAAYFQAEALKSSE